jgi:hypothetical protein
MMQRAKFVGLAIMLVSLLAFSGCWFRSPAKEIVTLSNATTGPHGGEWLDVGNQELFAEFVHGPSKLTIYLFDESMKRPASGDEEQIKLILPGLDGDREFILKSSAKLGERTEFSSTEYALLDAFEHENLKDARLIAVAIGKEYQQEFNHEPHGATGTSDKKP